MKESEVTLEGVVETGAQEHLYLEPCSTLVVPKKEDKEMEVFTGTQDAAMSMSLHFTTSNLSERIKELIFMKLR